VLPSQTETYRLTDPEFLEDPYPVYRRMRQHDPVYWSEALGHWVLTRYDDVLAATRNAALSSARIEVFVRAQLAGSDPALAADYTRINAGMMLMKDGREHHRLRVLGNHAFTPSALGRWQGVIERVVEDLLDAALPRGCMDVNRRPGGATAGHRDRGVVRHPAGRPCDVSPAVHGQRALLRRCRRRPRGGCPRRQRGECPARALLPRPAGGEAAPTGRRPPATLPRWTSSATPSWPC